MTEAEYNAMCERIFAQARDDIRRDEQRSGMAHSYVDVGDYKTADPDVLAARVASTGRPVRTAADTGARPRPRPRSGARMHARRKATPTGGRVRDDIDFARVQRPLVTGRQNGRVAPYHNVGRVPGVTYG